jgi:S1-C subfamily serine protease
MSTINTRSGMRTLVILLMVIVVAGCQSSKAMQTQPTASAPTTVAVSSQPVAEAASTQPSDATASFRYAIYNAAQIVKPAVVQVTNEQYQPGLSSAGALPVGEGSGILYDSEGHVLTNNHVVEGATKLIVSLTDGRSFDANLIGGDPQTDLAVVQISGSNLPVAQLGDSSQIQVGDWVVAIGNALALSGGPTVTAGVVSAVGRTEQESASSGGQAAGPFLFNLIQTDAAMNPGNSGGPLVNLDGQVIGINTLSAGSAGQGIQAEGIGFAIAIDTAKPIADQIVATGKVIHPYMGINYVPLNPAMSAYYGISVSEGILITNVVSGSPAAEAGLKDGDVVTEVDGTALKSESALAEITSQHKPGDTLKLTVLSGNSNTTSTVEVTLGTSP